MHASVATTNHEIFLTIEISRFTIILLSVLMISIFHVTISFQLSQQAVKDYNRGRAYLSSIANKCRVPIFSSVTDAVHSAVYMVKGRHPARRYNGRVPLCGTSV